eukprot:TRINITY_DN5202_c0_g1_i1.p1 TRINITY_DN5202_c0_g1~~TRINITY_DN5202_c0_g1_i1.p1  ORF type:complete len:862 (+),score=166.99 TRINITY_DN5202_c0_g1_i1:45-2630(+)
MSLDISVVIDAIRNTQSESSSVIENVMNFFEEAQRNPSYPHVLTDILVNHKNEQEFVRLSAAISLKNWVKSNKENVNMELYSSMFQNAVQLLGDEVPSVRKMIGGVISELIGVLVLREQKGTIVESIKYMCSLLDSSNEVVDGVLNALSLVSEDHTLTLSLEEQGTESVTDFLLPKMVNLWTSQHDWIRLYALKIVFSFFFALPNFMRNNMEAFINGLLQLSQDPVEKIRHKAVGSFCLIADIDLHVLVVRFEDIVELMLQATSSDDPKLAQDGCEFWQVASKYDYICEHMLSKYLPRIISALLTRMVFTDEILQDMNISYNDINTPEDATQIDYYYQEFDEMFSTSDFQWNVRKRAGEALDYLSLTYNDAILQYIFPFLQAGLQNEEWRIKEATVLAVGILSQVDGMEQHLNELVPFLIPLLQDHEPLIRSIVCWTLSKYSLWIFRVGGEDLFNPFFQGILNLMQDVVRRVRSSACASIGIICDCLESDIVNFAGVLLQAFDYGLKNYSESSLKRLYEAISSFAEAVGGEEMRKPEYTEIIQFLIFKWKNTSIENTSDISPIFSVIESIALVLKDDFIPYSMEIYNRCVYLVEEGLKALTFDDQNYDIEYLICPLELLSGLIEALSSSSDALIGKSNLIPMLTELVKYNIPDLTHAIFALVGDLARNCYARLDPFAEYFLSHLVQQGIENQFKEGIFKNACWAISEISLNIGDRIEPFIEPIMKKFINLLIFDTSDEALMKNLSVCLCRILINYASTLTLFTDYMEGVILYLCQVSQTYELETSLMGVIALCNEAPEKMSHYFAILCKLILITNSQNPELNEQIGQLLHSYKGYFGENWGSVYDKLPEDYRMALHHRYSL